MVFYKLRYVFNITLVITFTTTPAAYYRDLNNWDRYQQAVKLSLIGILLLEKKRLDAL